jgi:hypothetical protein
MRTLIPALLLTGFAAFIASAQEPARPAAATKVPAGTVKTTPGVVVERSGDNTREAAVAPASGERAAAASPRNALISFIDSPSATCIQPDPSQDICYINWYYLSVDANPNYMIAMSVTLNATGVVANVQGFFQTSMYVPYNQFGLGFKVQCGPPQLADPANPCSPQPCTDPLVMGNAYSYTIRARDSANLKSANYGTIYCPAFIP